jgi:hypothetical protein
MERPRLKHFPAKRERFAGENATKLKPGGLAPLGERRTLWSFSGPIQETADVARGLPDALFVLHKRDAQKPSPRSPKPVPRRHRHLGLLDQELGESMLPSVLNGSGIGDQANMEAAGGVPIRPGRSSRPARRGGVL